MITELSLFWTWRLATFVINHIDGISFFIVLFIKISFFIVLFIKIPLWHFLHIFSGLDTYKAHGNMNKLLVMYTQEELCYVPPVLDPTFCFCFVWLGKLRFCLLWSYGVSCLCLCLANPKVATDCQNCKEPAFT